MDENSTAASLRFARAAVKIKLPALTSDNLFCFFASPLMLPPPPPPPGKSICLCPYINVHLAIQTLLNVTDKWHWRNAVNLLHQIWALPDCCYHSEEWNVLFLLFWLINVGYLPVQKCAVLKMLPYIASIQNNLVLIQCMTYILTLRYFSHTKYVFYNHNLYKEIFWHQV